MATKKIFLTQPDGYDPALSMSEEDYRLQEAMDRSTGQRIGSLTDLITWVDSHIGDDATNPDIHKAAYAIQAMENRPPWGADWREFLEGIDLPTLY